MATYLWHPQSSELAARFVQRPAHALLIIGPAGSGKYTFAQELTRQLLKLQAEKDLLQHPSVKQPLPFGQTSIPIEFIRELRDFVKLKAAKNGGIARVVLIPDAERMQVAAANALLKLLEEPPEDTVIIMTATSDKSLLPTIVSRVRQMPLTAPGLAATIEFFTAQGYSEAAVRRTYMLSNGRLGLLAALLSEDTSHPLAQSVLLAKELLQAKSYERLVKVDELAKDKTAVGSLLDALEQILRAAIGQSAAAAKMPALQKLHHNLTEVLYAKELLRNNAQAKLLLDNLFLSL